MAKRSDSSKIINLRSRRRSRSMQKLKIPALILAGAAVLGTVVGIAPWRAASAQTPVYAERVEGCRAIDGDTLDCRGERIRLLAIDAPELPGHCRQGRQCVAGDPAASTSSLSDALEGQLTIDRVGEDRYGRTLARVAGRKGDLSCWQISRTHAEYKAAWDDGLRVARTCPSQVW
jgi:endonuclease YncB( thermonuclease family)